MKTYTETEKEQMTKETKYHFFYSGPFSNWYPSKFKVNSVEYNCGEQAMMIAKATIFEDWDSVKKIFETETPWQQKKLGREVKNFDIDVWAEKGYDMVKLSLREKFLQNSDLLDYLLKYKGYTIVEASPTDIIWGIGFSENDAMENIDDWGENRLGKILTELANELTMESKSDEV